MGPPIRVGVLGLGVVGGGVLAVLRRNAAVIHRRAGREIVVTRAAVRDAKRARDNCDGVEITGDALAVANAPEIDVVVELIGGQDLARAAVLQAIDHGKHIVTANKSLLALHGDEIFQRAHAAGVTVAFEAAVAGGIPVVKAIREGLAANHMQWLAGIINGTCNYILTAMESHGCEFAEALREAQRLGYAEAAPSLDVDGLDAAHKLAILARLAFDTPLPLAGVHTEGIRAITPADIHYARELGYRIKHLGIARRGDNGVELRVHPTLIPARQLLAHTDGVMNAVLAQADAAGATLYYGAGAGADATASAVIADLVDVARAMTAAPRPALPTAAPPPLLPMAEVETAYYVRLAAVNRPGVLAAITRIFGDRGISIDTILQKGRGLIGDVVTIIMLTQITREGHMQAALKQLRELDAVQGEVLPIRLEQLA